MMVSLLLVLALAGPASQPVQTLDELRREAREEVEREVANLDRLEPCWRRDLLRLSVEDGLPHVTTKLPIPPRGRIVLVPLRDWPGVATFTSSGDPREPSFALILRRFDAPGMVVEYTHVISGPGSTQLSRDAEGPVLSRSVQLVHTSAVAADPIRPLRLYVRELDQERNVTLVDHNLAAESLDGLRREHPEIVRKYLQPILDDLGIGQATLGVTVESALQVIAPFVPANPEMEARIDRLLVELDGDDFATRRRAQQSLAELGPVAAIALLRRDVGELSPEPRSAVEAFLAPFAPLDAADADAARRDPHFLAESILVLDPGLRAIAVRRLEELLGRSSGIDPSASDAAIRERVSVLRRSLGPTTSP